MTSIDSIVIDNVFQSSFGTYKPSNGTAKASSNQNKPAIEDKYIPSNSSSTTTKETDYSSSLRSAAALNSQIKGSYSFSEKKSINSATNSKSDDHQAGSVSGSTTPEIKLTESGKKTVEDLKRIDFDVHAHENAHEAAGGNLVHGKSFSYTTGPDGKQYAVGGEVQIDISEVPGSASATIEKMEQVKRAALAPVDPSSQDRSVASVATAIESKARTEATYNG
jgi:hypothetical protein